MRQLEGQMTEHTAEGNAGGVRRALERALQTGGGYEIGHRRRTRSATVSAIPATRSVQQLFSSASPAEKRRSVNLARLLLEKTDILLLDEPTNHLDMHAVEWLEGYIAHFKGTVLTISHDRYFLDRVVNRIIEISRRQGGVLLRQLFVLRAGKAGAL